MNYLKESSAEIRRLLPRLMKLTAVGCKIKTKTGVYLAEEWDTADGTYIVYRVGGDKSKPNYARLPESTKFKTIGHPITLSAIKDIIKIKFKDDELLRHYAFIHICETWKDDKPFSQQHREVHKFVENILFS